LLRGVLCGDTAEARAAAGRGADFVGLRGRVGESALAELCAELEVPVFARGLSVGHAWAMGASGVNALA
jgi:hypothetical protein